LGSRNEEAMVKTSRPFSVPVEDAVVVASMAPREKKAL
jgi:hypothetical protein